MEQHYCSCTLVDGQLDEERNATAFWVGSKMKFTTFCTNFVDSMRSIIPNQSKNTIRIMYNLNVLD